MRCPAEPAAADKIESQESAAPPPSARQENPAPAGLSRLGVCGHYRRIGFQGSPSRAKDLVDFFRQLEIVVADALHAVRIQVDHHFVPHVETIPDGDSWLPHERDARHVAERRDEILAGKLAVQLAVHHAPSCALGSSAVISGSDSFFAGILHPSGIGCHLPSHYAAQAPRQQQFQRDSRESRGRSIAENGSSLNARRNSIIVGVSFEAKMRLVRA